jgi:hypothetical protein
VILFEVQFVDHRMMEICVASSDHINVVLVHVTLILRAAGSYLIRNLLR